MNTLLLQAERADHLALAGHLLKAGQLVAVPTETVYGLAADASNPEAVAAIFAAKQRPRNHPLILHIGDLQQLDQWVKAVPDWVEPLARQFWPGPLTLLLDKHPRVSDVVTGGLPTIGVRIPQHPTLLSLLRQHQLAVAAPSANPYQKLSPTRAEHVMAGLNGRIAAVLDGGPCQVGTESTILRVTPEGAEILRAGPITASALQRHLAVPVRDFAPHRVAVSGNHKVHYRPNRPLSLITQAELQAQWPRLDDTTGLLLHAADWPAQGGHRIAMPADHQGYRQALYGALYRLDQTPGVARIWVEAPPTGPEWLDIWDRLQRAAGT